MGQGDAALRRLGVRALQRYDLREPRVRTISTRTNLILHVDARPGRSRTPQRFVLRVYRPNYHTDDALRSEQTWVHAASEATGVIMPRAVANLKARRSRSHSPTACPSPGGAC